jgi:hypothetical protein
VVAVVMRGAECGLCARLNAHGWREKVGFSRARRETGLLRAESHFVGEWSVVGLSPRSQNTVVFEKLITCFDII